jgi:hypothetical protein
MKARIELLHTNPKIIEPLLAIAGYLHLSSLGSRTNINTFNRLNIAFRSVPGDYRPGLYKDMLSQGAMRS